MVFSIIIIIILIILNQIAKLVVIIALLKGIRLIFFYYLFIFWLRWVFVAGRGLSLVAVSRGHSQLQCVGFSLRWLLLLRSMGSRRAGFSSCGSRALERRLSSCGSRAQLLGVMWDLPGPGLKPVSLCTGRRILNHCATREVPGRG